MHRDLRNSEEYQKNDILKAAHYLERKGERVVASAAQKLKPSSIYRYAKNAPYRKESKLQFKELKNDRNKALLLVKKEKLTGVSATTGKSSNVATRAWNKRQIRRNYIKARQAAKQKKGNGYFDQVSRELMRGNPKAVFTVAVKLLFKKTVVVGAKITILNPFFWKAMLLLLAVILMLLGVQLFFMLFAPIAAGTGAVDDEDIIFVSESYSRWEAEMHLFLEDTGYIESQLIADFQPPSYIVAQPGVDGTVIYPEAPYTPPPPFYEHNINFAIGLINHSPVELVSYLTAMYADLFMDDEMTQEILESILRELFFQQYGVNPDDWYQLFTNQVDASLGETAPTPFFGIVIDETTEWRQRVERRWEEDTEWQLQTDDNGDTYWEEVTVWVEVDHTIDYQFWIKDITVTLNSRNLTDVLRESLRANSERVWDSELGMYIYDREEHFDILNYTASGRQVVHNPFYGFMSEADRQAGNRVGFNWLPFVTSHFGYRRNPTGVGLQMHHGIDIAAPLGTPLFATHDAVVTQVQHSNTGYGNMIRLGYNNWSNDLVAHTDPSLGFDGRRVEVLYGHLDVIYVSQGQVVREGDLIGRVGTSGDSTGPHLHIEVIRPEQRIRVPNHSGSGYRIETLPRIYLNPAFAMISWTAEEGNENFRAEPGTGGRVTPNFNFPDFPPEAMSDERFMAMWQEAIRHMGARYVWGAAGPSVFDCSGFIHWVLSNAGIGWTHGRTNSQGYFNLSTPVRGEDARPGDLVFFSGTHSSGATVTHVGIYIGGGQMIHTGSNPNGVEIVNFANSPFWQRHFYAFGRI